MTPEATVARELGLSRSEIKEARLALASKNDDNRLFAYNKDTKQVEWTAEGIGKLKDETPTTVDVPIVPEREPEAKVAPVELITSCEAVVLNRRSLIPNTVLAEHPKLGRLTVYGAPVRVASLSPGQVIECGWEFGRWNLSRVVPKRVRVSK